MLKTGLGILWCRKQVPTYLIYDPPHVYVSLTCEAQDKVLHGLHAALLEITTDYMQKKGEQHFN